MEEISCGVGMTVDAKWVISKYLSVGVENRAVQEMNLECKQNCLVSIHSTHGVVHGCLVSVEFSSTLENFAKTKMMSRPWQKSVTGSCIWVWTTFSYLVTEHFLTYLLPLDSFRFRKVLTQIWMWKWDLNDRHTYLCEELQYNLGLQFSVLGGILIKLQMCMSQFRAIYKICESCNRLWTLVYFGGPMTLCVISKWHLGRAVFVLLFLPTDP